MDLAAGCTLHLEGVVEWVLFGIDREEISDPNNEILVIVIWK